MNIFKVLSSGDGSINEPNVSAFLGYLLNPNADHGLNDRFLKSIILELVKAYPQTSLYHLIDTDIKKEKIKCENINGLNDMSFFSNYEIEVYFEQAFSKEGISNIIMIDDKTIEEIELIEEDFDISKDDTISPQDFDSNPISRKGQKQIVDIIIKITGLKKHQNQKEDVMFLEKEVIAVLLIENKINNGSGKEMQLICQYLYSHEKLRKNSIPEDRIFTLFITPDSDKYSRQFESFMKPHSYIINENGNKEVRKIQPKGYQLFWKKQNNEQSSDSIMKKIEDMLYVPLGNIDNNLKIEPLNTYTETTIKAFYSFIRDDFKLKKPPEFQTLEEVISFLRLTDPVANLLTTTYDKIIKKFEGILDLNYTKTAPCSFSVKKGDRFILMNFYKNNSVSLTLPKKAFLSESETSFFNNRIQQSRYDKNKFVDILINKESDIDEELLKILVTSHDFIQNKT